MIDTFGNYCSVLHQNALQQTHSSLRTPDKRAAGAGKGIAAEADNNPLI